MQKYAVTVRYEMEREITVRAEDAQDAKERAVDIVSGWNDVVTADAEDAVEI